MPLKHATKVFNIDEAGIYPLTDDTPGALATYGALVRLPGIQVITYTPELMTKELPGDGTILDISTRIRKIAGTVTFAKKDLDVKALLLGGAVVDAGATPNQIASYTHKHGDRPGWFKLAWRVLDQGFAPATAATADTKTELFKCKITRYSGGGGQFEEYTNPSFDFEAIRLEGNATINGATVVSPVFSELFRETGAALS